MNIKADEMAALPDFGIQANGAISKEFLKRGIVSFHQATGYIQNLAYGRNVHKDDLTTVFIDNKGTCSTKHAILKQLAIEHGVEGIRLTLGIFKMNAVNTPVIEPTLSNAHLAYIPEAHTYLKYQGDYFDFTKKNSSPDHFVPDLLFETEIQPHEINQHKIRLHKAFLANWLHENKDIAYSPDEIWAVRELCIQALSE